MKLKPQAYALDAYVVPAHLFFCRRIELPGDLEKGEEEGYALLELENLSPFPLEHLYYGYRLDERRRYAFVFAAYKRRFEGVDTKDWRRLDAALPDFLVALKGSVEERSPLVLVTQASYVAFAFDAESSLPARIVSAPRLSDAGGDLADQACAVQAFWDGVSDRMGNGSPRIWAANAGSKWLGSDAWFGATQADEEPAAKVSYTREELWHADLRDAEMIEQSQRDERQNAFLWKGIVGLAAAIALLLLGELYWAGSSVYRAQREKWNEARVERVTAIDKLKATTNTLQIFQESNLVPFRIIQELWPYIGSSNIVFRRFETDGPDGLIIDARADSQREMTQFKKRLEAFDKVVDVRLSNQTAGTTGSTFKMTIRFQVGAFAKSREVASNG